MFLNVAMGFRLPAIVMPCLAPAAVKKSIRLREEALAKEQEKEKDKSSQTSAEKLRKILKEEKRYVDYQFRCTACTNMANKSIKTSQHFSKNVFFFKERFSEDVSHF